MDATDQEKLVHVGDQKKLVHVGDQKKLVHVGDQKKPVHVGDQKKLVRLRNALPQDVRQKLNPTIQQLKKTHDSPTLRYLPLRQLPSLFPAMTSEQLALVVAHVLFEAGLGIKSLGSLSTSEQMQMQMAMDRRSKIMEALSNVLKTIDRTDSAIVATLK